MLSVQGLFVTYSGIRALRNVSFTITAGEIVAFIGSNGAGKSTLLNCLSGIVPAAKGSIRFDGEELTGKRPAQIARRGMLQVPEGRQIFNDLSVVENLTLGRACIHDRPVTYDLDRVYELFPILAERRNQNAGSLSGGQQQMLAIGRSLMGAPKMLLLDEPSLGLAPIVSDQVFRALLTLKEQGLTLVVVEQNAIRALQITERAYVLERGELVYEGRSDVMRDDPQVAEHYLGVSAANNDALR